MAEVRGTIHEGKTSTHAPVLIGGHDSSDIVRVFQVDSSGNINIVDVTATHDSAVSATGSQVLAEAKNMDGAAFPNDVAEGDAVRVSASLHGILHTTLATDQGDQGAVVAHDDTLPNSLRAVVMAGAEAKTFDGSAMPTTGVAEGDATRVASSTQGILYAMPVNEDGSGTPLVDHDAAIGTGVGDSVILHGLEAKDFDGSALPNAVAEGDAVRAAGSLSGVGYVMPVSEDGSQSPYDSINNAFNVLEIAPEAQQETVVTLFNAELIDDTVVHASSAVNVSAYATKALLIAITVSAGAPTDVDVFLEYSPDNSTWYGQNSATEGIRMIDSNGNSVTVLTYTAAIEDMVEIPSWTKYLRANLQGAGTDGSNTFTVTLVLMAHGR